MDSYVKKEVCRKVKIVILYESLGQKQSSSSYLQNRSFEVRNLSFVDGSLAVTLISSISWSLLELDLTFLTIVEI